ncbi:crocetin glucosyltransferase, chloroplastic-like [Apium graveolens]|uniref:crocetin glucosyltransferase, chloroplastic-like n=1 Tax=Apium graveolens TaxID=4045 RepID=UPI003D7A2367
MCTMEHRRQHIILTTYPAQGHINPSLKLADKLVDLGMQVTFTTSISARRFIPKTYSKKSLCFKLYSDGYDQGIQNPADAVDFYNKLKSYGAKCVEEIIVSSAQQGNPVTCLVYTIFYHWVAEVARGFDLPSMLYWIQPAAVFAIYYYYFNGYKDAFDKIDDPSWSIKLPGLPLLNKPDLPSFIIPSSQDVYTKALASLKQHFDALSSDPMPKVLINSFEDLEHHALKSIDKLILLAVGPVIQSAFLDGKHDSFDNSRKQIDWLNSKGDSSVIYVSFGTMINLPKSEMEEIAKALLKSGRPFLWIVKKNKDEKEEDKLSCMDKLEEQGLIVPWCSQVEVLSHKALGCFVTHCGWNSTLETLASGVPVVAYPKWTDQGTIAKMIQDVWKTGVRVNGSEQGNVDGDEIYQCLETVMGRGEKAEELRRNAEKWKDLAREAVKHGGTSYKHLKGFVEEM